MRTNPFSTRRSLLMTAFAAIALLTTTTAFAARPQPVPNSQKYQDRAPYTHAAAGDVEIQVRALLRASGSTKVEITTGQLDDLASAKDIIEKVQLKITTAGKLKTRNYNNTEASGTFAVSVSGLSRGDAVEIQVHVRDAETNKMEVIEVTTPVRRSPDLAVTRVDAPATVTAGQPVSVMATITEINGDTGARATCKLYVDGTRVDEAQNIWVDAGDTVNCAFSTTLTAGTHTLRVTASSVVPSDWDKANNAAETQITAKAPDTNPSPDTWTWSIYQETTAKQFTTTWSDRPAGYDDYSERTDRGERSVFNATIYRAVNFSDLLFKSVESTDGKFTADFTEYDFVLGGSSPDCRSAGMRMWLLSVCSSNGKTTINFTRTAGRSTYLSRWWSQSGDTWVQYEMEDEDPPFGRSQPLGTTAELDITLSGTGWSWRAQPFAVLEAYEKPEEVTETCTTSADVTRCTTARIKVTGKRGSDTSE
jgi:hypothetical protein